LWKGNASILNKEEKPEESIGDGPPCW